MTQHHQVDSQGRIILWDLEELVEIVKAEREARLIARRTRAVRVRSAKPDEFDTESLFEGEE